VIGKFSEEVVRTGELSTDDFRVYAKLLNWRAKGDYSDLYNFDKEAIDSIMEPTKRFIDRVSTLIQI
jgi:uncharacterized protein (UPF0332 family)